VGHALSNEGLNYKVRGTRLCIEHDVDEDVAVSQQVALLFSHGDFLSRTIIMGVKLT
jgi:hypothetical protein